jgi:nitronate monooxygenase
MRDKATLETHNLVALDREVRAALEASQGHGAIAVNVHESGRVVPTPDYVRQSCGVGRATPSSWGAGLLLPSLEPVPTPRSDFPECRAGPDPLPKRAAVAVVLRKWIAQEPARRPPSSSRIRKQTAGGQSLAPPALPDVADRRFDLAKVLEETFGKRVPT